MKWPDKHAAFYAKLQREVKKKRIMFFTLREKYYAADDKE